MIKRAYAYLRVSTFQQVDGKSLTGQEEEIRKYCNVYGIELVDVYSDEGKSGKSIEGRPQFQKMLRDIKEKQEVDYVIVWKLSRFGRNACDSLNSLNILQDNGVNLVALTENVDTATPMGRLVFTLLAALAEMERENIREQTANGLKYNALSGGWNGGIPPYGYDAVNKELVINEEEAAVVRKIFEWYLESEEASCDSVTGRLNEEGIKPRHYKRVDRKATEESETDETVYLPPVADWYTSQVKKILDNPTVCGKIRYGYHKTDDSGNKGKPSNDSENDYILVDGKHEAIISEEMWNRAQEKRKKSRKPRGRRDSTSENVNNVFNGIVKCPQCGAHMINYGSRYKRANGEESYYSTYVCGYWNNHKKGKCRKNPIKTEILEKAVIGGLREYTRRPNLAEEIHQYMEQELDTGKLEKETEELKNKIAALDKNEDMQYKILCQIGVNPTYQNMKPERIQINLDKIATEKKELQEKLDYKMKQIESVQLEKMDFELVKNLLENFNEVYEDAPKELRKRLVRSLIKEVQLGYDDKGKVVPVKMILKFSGEQIELMKEHKENFGLNEAHADSIHSNGDVFITGGDYTLSSRDDGIHADDGAAISGGSIKISESYEGIEGLTIDITGGQIDITASDDGVNAAGGRDGSSMEKGQDPFVSMEGAYISISGGSLRINASGDGISSLDYNGKAVVTGGIFASSGASGMAQNFDPSSTQGIIMVTLNPQEAGTQIALKNSDGTELLSWKAEKEYSSVLISSPDIRQGERYSLTAGTEEKTITMDSLVYGTDIPENGKAPVGSEIPKGGRGPENSEVPTGGRAPMEREPAENGKRPGEMDNKPGMGEKPDNENKKEIQ